MSSFVCFFLNFNKCLLGITATPKTGMKGGRRKKKKEKKSLYYLQNFCQRGDRGGIESFFCFQSTSLANWPAPYYTIGQQTPTKSCETKWRPMESIQTNLIIEIRDYFMEIPLDFSKEIFMQMIVSVYIF